MKIRDELEKAAMPTEAKPSQTTDKHCLEIEEAIEDDEVRLTLGVPRHRKPRPRSAS